MTTAVPQPDKAALGRRLTDVLGPSQPLDTLGAVAGVLEIALADSTPAYATVHWLASGQGQVTVVHRRADALAAWRSDTALTVTLSATTGFVVLILGFAFHWQATRAREADVIYETVRTRIDTALNRGRCGLWDWELGARPHLLVAFDVRDPGAEAEGRALELRRGQCAGASGGPASLSACRTARRSQDLVDRPRLPHASRQRQLGVAARALRAGAAAGRSLAAPDRHRRRHHRAEDAGREDGRGRPAPARRDRDHPGGVRAVGCEQPHGAVQLQFPGAAQPARRGGQGRHAL